MLYLWRVRAPGNAAGFNLEAKTTAANHERIAKAIS
jgi:hypothetical protein